MRHTQAHHALLLILSLLLTTALLSVSTAAKEFDATMAMDDSDKTYFVNQMELLITQEKYNVLDLANGALSDKWKPSRDREISDFANRPSLWFRITFDPTEQLEAQWLFVIHVGMIRHAQIFTFNHATEQWWQSRPLGLNYPLEDRYFKTRNLAFPLEIQPGQKTTLYLNVNSSNLVSMPISVSQADKFEAQNAKGLLIIGGFLGSLVIMLLYNLSLFGVLRDKLYFVYSFYIFVVIFYQLILTGIGALYFWYDNPWLNDYGAAFSASLTFFSACLFFRIMLDLKHQSGWALHSNTALLICWGLVTVASIFTLTVWATMNILSLTTSIIGITVACYLGFVRKHVIARIFLFAWGLLIISTFVFMGAINGLLPYNQVTSYSQMFGFFAEMVLLSFALSYRINRDKKIREAAQEESLKLTLRVSEERKRRLQAQKDTLEMQKSLNEQLEKQVDQRTEQLQEALKQLESANDELTQLSITDQLTQLHNRRYFDEALSREYHRAHRSKLPIAVILVDIDHFKPINDDHGHMVGDLCLKRVASALRGIGKRPGDILARYGGEEFIYVLPGNNLDSALVLAERARQAIEDIEFVHDGKRLILTASFGVAAWVPSRENDYAELVQSADDALYSAKEAGRNCVMSASRGPKAVQIN